MRLQQHALLAALLLFGSVACTSDAARSEGMHTLNTPAHLAFGNLKKDLAAAPSDADPIAFVEAYQNAMMQDMPFHPDARFAALERLANLATDPTYSSLEVMAAIEIAVDAELGYAYAVSDWTDEVDPQTGQTGRHSHFGRLAIIRETPDGAQCFDMATSEFAAISDAQYRSLLATMVTASDIVPNNLPPHWPCAYLAEAS